MKLFVILVGIALAAGEEYYDCDENTPCTKENIAAGNFYFASSDPRKFVQCDAHGGCWVMPCAPGTEWDQEKQTCDHADTESEQDDEYYDCTENNPCTEENIAAGNFYFAYSDPRYFVQCDAHGGCFIMPCGPRTEWDQEKLTCDHADTESKPACTDGPVAEEVVCENVGSAVLTCAQGTKIQVQGANYGRTKPSSELCEYYKKHNDRTDCVDASSEKKVRAECDGKQACVVPANNGHFGDPCLNTYKYLSVTYQCVCEVQETFDCDEQNPCDAVSIAANGGYYFPHHEETNFVQCDDHGGCFVMPCGPRTRWSQEALTCVHDW